MNDKSWREKIDAAYAANTGAKLAADEADRIERNNTFAREREQNPKPASPPLTRQEIAYLAKEEAEMDAATEQKIKQTVRERHCSRAEAKDWLRERGLA